jgi:hypothetical protein
MKTIDAFHIALRRISSLPKTVGRKGEHLRCDYDFEVLEDFVGIVINKELNKCEE